MENFGRLRVIPGRGRGDTTTPIEGGDMNARRIEWLTYLAENYAGPTLDKAEPPITFHAYLAGQRKDPRGRKVRPFRSYGEGECEACGRGYTRYSNRSRFCRRCAQQLDTAGRHQRRAQVLARLRQA